MQIKEVYFLQYFIRQEITNEFIISELVVFCRANFFRWGDMVTPHGIKPVKGAVHIMATRAFIYFLLHDQRAVDFHEWTKSTIVPAETLFSSVNFNQHLHAPGGYNGQGKYTFIAEQS